MSGTLSAIDVGWPGHARVLVPLLDQLGYRRLWATEHHGPRQSASPMLLAAIAAGLSERIRVGTAGVLLSLRSPLRVAEEARMLDLFYPGRFDLGVAGAVPQGPVRAALLDGRSPDHLRPYRDKVAELIDLVEDRATVDGEAVVAGPQVERQPSRLWVCGTTERSAEMAAELGTNFAFHHYLARPGVDGPAAVRTYRRTWEREHGGAPGEVVVAAYGLCAPTDDEAESAWESAFGGDQRGKPRPSPSFLGSPSRCRDALDALREAYCVDELVVQSLGAALPQRVRSYELLVA